MMQNSNASWFDQCRIGDIILKNRIVMAPIIRLKCDPKTQIPNELMHKYYSQRTGFGLIITEATSISKRGNGYIGVPGIFTEEQVQGWKKITDTLHQDNCKIILQIWHAARRVIPKYIDGLESWAPSPIAIRGGDKVFNDNQPFPVPHEMTKQEIKQCIEEFRQGAQNAKIAGFDGIILHGANGYMVDEFLRDGTNKRTDEYGGSIENRCRFALEVIDQLIEVFGKLKVGIKVTPVGRKSDMYDSDPLKLFSTLFKLLSEKGIGFIEITEADNDEAQQQIQPKKACEQMKDVCKELKPFFNGSIINNGGLNQQTGLERIKQGLCEAVSFATLAISNPDLPKRFELGVEVNPPDYATLFTQGDKGYTDCQTIQGGSYKK